MTQAPRHWLALAILTCFWTTLPAQDEVGKQDPKPTIPADKKVEKHQTGLVYSILEPGDDKGRPDAGDSAKIHFKEWLKDGTLIHSTADSGPVSIDIGSTRGIFALNFGPTLIGTGGRIKVTAPPHLAYGAAGQRGRIPPNSTMIYEIELVEWKYRPKAAEFIPADASLTKATKSGLKYQIQKAGKGQSPALGDIVEIEYTTWTLTGEPIFGTYRIGETVRAPIQSLSHKFFHEALPMMKTGSEWRLTVPKEQTVEQMSVDTVWHVRLIDHHTPEAMPPSNDKAATTTKSGLVYERLTAGKGDRPTDRFFCELDWDFWKTDGTYIAGSSLVGKMPVVVGKAEHKFLDEIVKLMQIGEVMRVEVPDTMTPPRMLRFKTVWRLKLLRMQKPLPVPTFRLPKAEELTKTKSGLQYKVLARGDGKGQSPRAGTTVEVHYSGWLTDGKPFDSSYEKGVPATFRVGEVIPGWNEGLKLMKPGDTFLFVIPGPLGYGARGTPDGTIGPDATLVFQVKLLGIH
jgi:FKBP-type peptidyl-prolyl cis-trans isomerase